MTNQFSPRVSEILAFSRAEALRLASGSIGPEHLLLGIIKDNNQYINDLFAEMRINKDDVRAQLEEKIQNENSSNTLFTTDIALNDKANNVLKLAIVEARLLHLQIVDIQHVLLAILHDSYLNNAKIVLESNNMNYDNTKEFLYPSTKPQTDGLELSGDEEEELSEGSDFSSSHRESSGSTATKTEQTKSKTPILDNFSTNLTKAASEGLLDPVVGREREILRLAEILCRRKKNNPILIGEPGVGKSAIVENLAQLIVQRKTSPVLFNKKIVALDMASIVAGTKYRGQFEDRIKALLKELKEHPEIIVFIDEIHTIIGAGGTPGSMDAANIMKPELARGGIQCIGATTLDEYRNSIEKDGALERRFQKIIIEQTTAQETLQILSNIKDRYEQHHHVQYTDDALKACVNLSERYINDRFFPDKAIDVMDEVGSKVHLRNLKVPKEVEEKEKEIKEANAKKSAAVKNQNYELAANYRDKVCALEKELDELNAAWTKGEHKDIDIVTEKEVSETVSIMTGVPVERIAEAEGSRLKAMSDTLKKTVIAQDNAIDKVVKAIQRNRVGLKDPNHPIGVFMFLGPTGIGKTHLAKKLAQIMFGSDDALIRIDMSEYSEGFNTSRLIGAPPGYVGYEEGGQLTEKVRRKPYSIILLDEIEKAHGNVFNMLLQVLDEGRLTDGNGRIVDFRNTIIIMTSNAGTRQLKDFGRGVGFNAGGSFGSDINESDKEYARGIIQKSLSKQFAPEFLNRLDEIVMFDQLDLDAILKITDIELASLTKRIEQIGYQIEISDKAKEFVAKKGYDVQFGARPLKRAIQTYIENGISELILSDTIKLGDTISVGKVPNKEELTFK